MPNKKRVMRLAAYVLVTLFAVTMIGLSVFEDSTAFGIDNDAESELVTGADSNKDTDTPAGKAVQETDSVLEDLSEGSVSNNADQETDFNDAESVNKTEVNVELLLNDSIPLSPHDYTTIGEDFEWTTSDESIATIAPDGLLEARNLGRCDVTATSEVTGYTIIYHVAVVYDTIENCSVDLEYTSAAYTGNSLEPEVIVTDANGEKVLSDYYTVRYENNIEVGTATVIVSGNNLYGGSRTMTFNITQELSNCTVNLSYYSKEYTGKALEPKVIVKDPADAVVPSECYTVSYKNNIKIGVATVTVTGGDFYTGTKSETFKIIQNLSKCKVKLAYSSKEYTGKKLKPKVTVTDSTGTVVPSKYYTLTYTKNTAIGKAIVIVKGKDLYTGSTSKTFTIKPPKGVVNKVTPGNKTATVTAKKLKGGVKYQVQYKKAGKSKWKTIKFGAKTSKKIKGLANNKNYYFRVRAYKASGGKIYYGAWSKSKKVLIGIPISKCTVKGLHNLTYNGKNQLQKDVKVYFKGKLLKASRDYRISYGNHKYIGKRYIIVTGKGKYAGKVKKYYKIRPARAKITGMCPYPWYENDDDSYSSYFDESPDYEYYNNDSMDADNGYYIMAVDLECSKVAGGVSYEFAFRDKGSKWDYASYGSDRSVSFFNYPEDRKVFAKVRAYKRVNGEKICGPWSTIQTETLHYKKVRLSDYYEKNNKYISGKILGGYKGEIITLKIGKKTYTKKITKNGTVKFKFHVGRIKAGTGYKVILQTKFKETIYTYNDTAWYAIKIKNGMTKHQVRYTWGRPDDTSSSSGGWTYWYYDDGSYVYFKNGKVRYWYNEE